MSFTYNAGTTTPNLAGLAQIGGIRLNDGTFELHLCGRLTQTPPVRSGVGTLSIDHGGFPGTPYYDPFPFTLEGIVTVPVLTDLWAALDLLYGTFALIAGVQTLTLNTSGWSASRQIDVVSGGPVQITEPVLLEKMVPDREFVVPLIAPDPRLYAVTAQSVTIGASHSLTNAGTTPAPFTVRFNGPQTDPELDGPGSAGSNRVRWVGTIASGHYVEVTTNPATKGGITAKDDTGASVYGDLGAFTADTIPVGTSTWTTTNTSGSGSTVVTFRDAWS